MNDDKLLIGLIGAGIQRSLTPSLHEEEARRHGLRLHYQLIDLDQSAAGAAQLPALLESIRTIGFAGLNVTYPCKQAIVPLLDELSDEARVLGAVNTVVIREGRMTGHNTDGSGWAWAFKRGLPDARLRRVVQLGAGGAGAAIADAALRIGTRQLIIFDREPGKAGELVERLSRHHGSGRASVGADLEATLKTADGLVHCTPTGMDKLPGLPLPRELLHPALWISEIVYFPLETELLKVARAVGCRTVDGGGMAVGQAVGAFRLFTGREPDAARMDHHFRELVGRRQVSSEMPA
jgi:shikimate dehydrogenase